MNAARRSDWHAVIIITVAWMALVFVVNPTGNFPLIDDWSYARSVQALLNEHALKYDGWNSPTLFFQLLYGAAFCWVFGFSFETLRYSTLVAGLAGCIGAYSMLRVVTPKRRIALLGSAVLLTNPVYFQHAFTFMTDVPFTALAIISGTFFTRWLKSGANTDIVYGTAAACCATLVRQIGVAIPCGLFVAVIVIDGIRTKTALLSAVSFAATCTTLAIYNVTMEVLHMVPAMSGATQRTIAARAAQQGIWGFAESAAKEGFWVCVYIGIVLLPFVFMRAAAHREWHNLSAVTRWLVAAICGAVAIVLSERSLPPYTPLQVFRVLPTGLVNAGPLVDPLGQIEPFPQLASVITAFAFAFLVAVLVPFVITARHRLRPDSRFINATTLFGLATSAFMLVPAVLGGFMERYVIPAIPFLLLLLTATWTEGNTAPTTWVGQLNRTMAFVTLALFATLGVIYTHDMLVMNRTLWRAVDHLVNDIGVPPNRIDGGFPANGWYLFASDPDTRDRFLHWQVDRYPRGVQWWRNHQADYVICFNECPADPLTRSRQPKVIWSKPYSRWLPGTNGSIVVYALR